MRNVALVLAVAAVAAAVVVAPTANASRYMKTGIFDDAQVLYGDPDWMFGELKKLRSQVVRVNLWWGGPSGFSVARRKPKRPIDPNDPAYDWDTYDRTVRYAAVNGMTVVFSIIGTPPWANKAAGFNVMPTSILDLRRFATAAARRYDGTFKAPDGRTLPAVRQWLAWNEPNNPVFLKPQWALKGSRWVPVAATNYARICNAVVEGIRSGSTAGRPKVACGATAPRGNNQPTSTRSSISPLAFMRAMWKGGARGFDAYAHHPYYQAPSETPRTPPPPGKRGQPPTSITLGNFNLLVVELTRLYGNMRIWITEYGYQTNPPDEFYGVTPAKQAAYLKEAWTYARRHPRIDMFLWFLLVDEPRLSGWQSGLIDANGRKKPAYRVFQTLR